MSEDEIRLLVARAREGDDVAFTALYDAFAPRILRFLRCRVDTPEAAEDLLQRVFLKMIEQLPHYRDRGLPFAAWLFRVARNAAIDAHRTTHPQLPLDVLAWRAADTGDPEQLAQASMDRAAVREAIGYLPQAQRDVIECRFFADLSPCETAAVLGRSEGSVRVMQHRAIAALRQRLVPAPPLAAEGPKAAPR